MAPKAIGAGTSLGAKAVTALWLKLFAAGVVTVVVAGGVAMKVRSSANHADATMAERGERMPGAVAQGTTGSPSPKVTTPATVLAATPPSEPTTVVNAAPEAPLPVAVPVPVPTAASAPLKPEGTRGAPEGTRAVPEGARVSANSSAPSTAPTESPLARELRLLDDARSALGRGDASGALAALDRHDRAFPAGALRTEANVMRAEALLARGDRAAARKLASDLLARDPSGPAAKRLRTIADAP
jgi:hypothetical protein